MRVIIGAVVFVACVTLYLIGYRVTPPPNGVGTPPATETTTACPPPDTPEPTAIPTVGTRGGGAAAGAPARGWPCPGVTPTITITAVPPDQQ